MRPKQQTHMGIALRKQWGATTYLEGGNEHGQTQALGMVGGFAGTNRQGRCSNSDQIQPML
jgi:hypothetical protein